MLSKMTSTQVTESDRTYQHYGVLLEEQIMANLLAFHRQLSSRRSTVNSLESIWQMEAECPLQPANRCFA